MDIGNNIKRYRKISKLTQKQLGESIGKSEISIRKYESNASNPPLEVLSAIASTLGISINYLMESDSELISPEQSLLNIIEKFKQCTSDYVNISNNELSIKLLSNLLQDLLTFIESFSKITKVTLENPKFPPSTNNNKNTIEAFNKINSIQEFYDNVPQLIGRIVIDLQEFNKCAQNLIDNVVINDKSINESEE